MKTFWCFVTVAWGLFLVFDMINGNSIEYESTMMFLSLILANTSE